MTGRGPVGTGAEEAGSATVRYPGGAGSSGSTGDGIGRLEPFDPAGALPGPGTTVLQASAGTGKTWTITSLVARFVASGVALDQVLAVTFTRMATGELRHRVRQRLIEVEEALASRLAGATGPAGDPVLDLLGEGDRDEIEVRHRRLADALTSFDAATIATTHGFCQLVLDSLGSAGDVATRLRLLEEPGDLVDQVVDDLYLRHFLRSGDPGFTRDQARAATVRYLSNPGAELVPSGGDDAAGLLSRLVRRASSEVGRRLHDDDLVTYDRMLTRLAGTLSDPDRGPLACQRLRRRYSVVLVDEFQDTDPVQWEFLRRAFGAGAATMILVGDPKQAIYSFRGADVYSYLAAARSGRVATLGVNRRSDQPLLDATEALLSPLAMGHRDIRFDAVRAPADRAESGVRGLPRPAPLRVRLVSDRHPEIQRTAKRDLLQKGALVDWVASDVAADIAGLLAAKPEIRCEDGAPEGGAAGAPGRWRAVEPRHIAVLTRTNRQSVAVRDALRRAGVPAVITGLDSVFSTTAADAWLRLLEALEEPAQRSRAAALALTPFVGLDAAAVAGADETVWESIHARAHRWAAVLADRGVAALYRAVTAGESLPARVLGRSGGERELTDLTHVAELLHAEATSGQVGLPSLRSWLARRIAAVESEESGAPERTRRLDSDREAVQVLTVHRAKGLEFGIVYCPYLWDTFQPGRSREAVVFHDPDRDERRCLDVGQPPADGPAARRYQDHAELYSAEQQGEELRLMYVALTRARHQVVVWWGRADRCRFSPLGRLLMCRDLSSGEVSRPRSSEPREADIRKALDAVTARAGGLVEVDDAPMVGRPLPAGPDSPPAPVVTLAVARFERDLDRQWRRASYSSITASAHEPTPGPGVGSEPETSGTDDEPARPAAPLPDAAEGGDGWPEGVLATMVAGAEVGTFAHAVLEDTDFSAADLDAELNAAADRQAQRAVPAGVDRRQLVAGLADALRTPLGPLVEGVTLASIGRPDRADELTFEFPVAGGDAPAGTVTTASIATVVARHIGDSGPLAGYAGRLHDPLLATSLRGYMTGSLDLVFRRSGADGVTRWYVADYKTNRLSGSEGRSSTWQYRPGQLDEEMQRRHYPLQAMIYLVALHRFLRWRVPGYDPARDLGGVLYLFVRGMVGPATPVVDGRPCGVFAWRPPTGLVVDLSDLFASGAPS